MTNEFLTPMFQIEEDEQAAREAAEKLEAEKIQTRAEEMLEAWITKAQNMQTN